MRLEHVLASLICLPLVGCLDENAVEEEENLSTTESNLCSDGAPDAVVAFDDYGGESSAKSALPTNSYDHPACSDRFTVEVTGVGAATQEFSVLGGWGEPLPTTSQSACELAFANVQTHEYRSTLNCSGGLCFPQWGWHQVGGDVLLQGQWTPFFGSHLCLMAPTSPLPVFQPSLSRSKVRVAVRAYAWALFFPAYKKGEAGLWSAPIIY